MDWSLPDAVIIASIEYANEISEYLHKKCDANKIIKIDQSNIIPVKNKLSFSSAKPDSVNWIQYYKDAESCAQSQFQRYIMPILKKLSHEISFDSVLDFACGRGPCVST